MKLDMQCLSAKATNPCRRQGSEIVNPLTKKANWERPVASHIFLADAADSAKNISIELEVEVNKMRK